MKNTTAAVYTFYFFLFAFVIGCCLYSSGVVLILDDEMKAPAYAVCCVLGLMIEMLVLIVFENARRLLK